MTTTNKLFCNRQTPSLLLCAALLYSSLLPLGATQSQAPAYAALGGRDPQAADFAACSCDLLPAPACDINCCCDASCSAADKAAFTQCIPQPQPFHRRCTRDAYVYRSNTQQRTRRHSQEELFCVLYETQADRTYYPQPRVPLNAAAVAELTAGASYASSFTAGGSSPAQTPPSNQYRLGTAIRARSVDRRASGLASAETLPLPAPVLSDSTCARDSVASFLIDQRHVACSWQIPDLATVCQAGADANNNSSSSSSESWLDWRWLGTTRIARTPDANFSIEDQSVPVIVEVNGGNCTNSTTCVSALSYNTTTGICSNVPLKVAYIISVSATTIESATVQVLLGDVAAADSLPLRQQFSLEFRGFGSTGQPAASANAYPKSGAPGYLRGKPVLSGLTTENNTVALDTDSTLWLTVLKAQGRGDCAEAIRVPVNFGSGMTSGCLLRLRPSDFSGCQTIRQRARDLLAPASQHQAARVIGKYGNASQLAIEDWVSIIDAANLPAVAATDPGDSSVSCGNVLTGVELVLIWARLGELGNSQATIVGAEYRYTTVTLRATCVSAPCGPDDYQPYGLSNAVNFVDVTEAPSQQRKDNPDVVRKLPRDFFAPFT